jgi:hypothetical protein
MGSPLVDRLQWGEHVLAAEHLLAWVVHAQNQVKRSTWRRQPVGIAFGGTIVLDLQRERVVFVATQALSAVANRVAA